MFAVLVGLRKIPDGALRSIVAAAPQDGRPSMFIDILIRPLPYIANHIQDSKRARPFWMCIDVARCEHHSTLIG